ncbi:hypothetical protein HID58_023262 [Brassica napus]|uniref:Uncharacterized protein n=1 Tax=Brassica napus TaxID=3708 RepID=A0ABQ8D1L0_BRANA|nr:hypothetical protein HID58_023262 [Brassica napus]
MKSKEEARSNGKFEQDPLSAEKAEKELLKLIGGSRKARDRSLFKKFGLVLKTDHIDDDLLDDLEEDLRDDEHFFIDHPVAVHIRLLPVLRNKAMFPTTVTRHYASSTSLGRDPLFLSSSLSKSDRAAAIKIRREKRLLQERQLEEKAMIEERMKVRQEERLAIIKREEEEEARSSNCKFEQDHPLFAQIAEKELLKLIGGSRKARKRSIFA